MKGARFYANMNQPSGKPLILFVDDEESIRLTLPAVLKKAGFEVRVAASVQEALLEINTQRFDALITDLNIADPGDGLLVISAMRHIQPNCTNFILTGYPAFETALEAIHHQVHDYLVKPVNADVLVSKLKDKISRPKSAPTVYRVPELLANHRAEILAHALEAIKRNSQNAGNAQVDEKEVAAYLGACLDTVIRSSQQSQVELTKDVLRRSAEYVENNINDGSGAALAAHFHALESAIYRVLEENFPLTALISDLKVCMATLHSLLEQSLVVRDRLSSAGAHGQVKG